MFNPAEQSELLRLARQAIETRLGSGEAEIRPAESPGLQVSGGAFVTLHRGSELRGCIGRIVSSDPIYLTVQEMAVAAATEDRRFLPVEFEELARIHIEISALSPPQVIPGVEAIEVGRDGLIVSSGFNRGLLLPQVATEWGWDAAAFLSHTCQKAGLPMDFWKTGQPKIEAFQAEVFSEPGKAGLEI